MELSNTTYYILAYLIGAIPFGLIIAKNFAGVDVSQSGSQSIGATNVLRVVKEKDPKLAKKLGASTLLLDALKGMIVLLLAKFGGLPDSTLWGIALLSVIGHCYSPYLGFEGGKGVATGLGVLLVLEPTATLGAIVAWGFSAKVLKISSLSSLIGLAVLVNIATTTHNGLGVNSNMPLYFITFIIFYKHIPNIIRVIKGQEKKVV